MIGKPEKLDAVISRHMKRGEPHVTQNRLVWKTRQEAEAAVGSSRVKVYAILADWEDAAPLDGSEARVLRRKAPIIRLLPEDVSV